MPTLVGTFGFIHAWRGSTVLTKVDTHHAQAMPFRQIAKNCQRRGGSGCGGVRGMDAAVKPPWTGLRRPPQPDPPRPRTDTPLLTLTLTLIQRVQGAALPHSPSKM